VSYILDSRHRFIYCNPACDCFARSNGAPQLAGEALIGFDLFDAIPEALCAVYSEAFQQVLTGRSVWEKSYECSSPTLFRKDENPFLEEPLFVLNYESVGNRKPAHKFG